MTNEQLISFMNDQICEAVKSNKLDVAEKLIAVRRELEQSIKIRWDPLPPTTPWWDPPNYPWITYKDGTGSPPLGPNYTTCVDHALTLAKDELQSDGCCG
jgi:hypothetical protein